MLTVFIICALAGIGSGFIAGFFGLGGGLVVVPTIVFILPHITNIPAEYLLQIGIGSSFVTIILNSTTASYQRIKAKLVDFNIVKRMIIPLLLSTFIVGMFAARLPQDYLKVIFGLILLTSSIKMIRAKNSITIEGGKISTGYLIKLGVYVGSVAAVSGTGGGAFITPGLARKGLDVKKAVGVSNLSGLFISLSGAFSFAMSGLTLNTGLEMSTGFLYWPAIIGILSTSIISAYFSTKLAAKVHATKFKHIFGWFLIIVSANFLINGLNGIYTSLLH